MLFSNRIKASTVRDISSARRIEFKKTVNVLRSQIDSQIMEAASQGLGCVIVDVPKHYIGREPYDWIQMGRTLVELLLEDGYYVSGTYIKFKITWEHPIYTKPPKSKPKSIINIPSIKPRH